MNADEEYEGGPDDLVGKLADLDEELAEQRATALRASLSDYELEDEDAALLAGVELGEDGIQFLPALPVVAIVGRPNVGKSALPGVVVEGRDITTVVAPDAPVRILLTASPEVRAARRSAEVTTQDAASVADALHRRDASDSKVVDFLTAAPGVVVVDSTDLDFNQTVAAVLDVVQATTLRPAQALRQAQGPGDARKRATS